MAFNTDQKALDLLSRNMSRCRYEDLEEWTPKYLLCTVSYLVEELVKRRLPPSVANVSLQATEYIKEEKFSCNEIVTAAVMFSLENMARRHEQKNGRWHANKFVRGSHESRSLISSSDFLEALRQAIVSCKDDAKILMKEVDELMWLAVLYKRQNADRTLLTSPVFVVVSTDLRYVFWQKEIPSRLKEALLRAVESQETKQLELAGADVQSLYIMLQSRAIRNRTLSTSDVHMPENPCENDIGINFTAQYHPSINTAIHIDTFTIQPKDKRWKGDDAPELRLLEVDSEVTFSGDVAAIMAQLPVCGICSPPLPDFIANFKRNRNLQN